MELIPLSSMSVGNLEAGYLSEAVRTGMFSSAGPFVAKFEKALAARLGCDHVIATSSGSAALELCLRALEIGPGDEVIVPAFTFAAPAAATAMVGATPIFADVDWTSWTIDPEDVAKKITHRTRAIIAVDVLGHPCDFDRLERLGVPVIEDAAQSHGAMYRGRPTGRCGLMSIFSFYANKTIATGEGGCVVTANEELAERVRLLNNFGMSRQRRYWHVRVGSNYRMTNVVAAVGLAQVERWDELVASRRRVARLYDEGLRGSRVERRPVAPWAEEAPWLYTIRCSDRGAILRACEKRAIDARAVWPAVHSCPAFTAFARGPLPVAETLAAEAIWLPTWSGMTDPTIARVVEAVLMGAMELAQ